MAYERFEVFTGRARRRGYTAIEKSRMIAEAFLPGVVVADAARRLGVDASQLYRWRRLSEEEPSTAPRFLVVADTTGEVGERVASEPSRSGRLEIDFPTGVRLRVDGAFDPATLGAAIGALKGRAE
jgi:transposase